MAADRRVVRVSQAFFDQLDEQLPPERGPEGEPSATDFVVNCPQSWSGLRRASTTFPR